MNNLPIIGTREEIQKNASKAAPSNKQKRQHVAIVARVPDIIFLFFFSIRLFVPKHVSSYIFHQLHHVPFNCFESFASKTPRSQHFFSFLQDAIAIHLLSNTILPVCCSFLFSITYATFHFEALCHRKKIPSKSFVLCSLPSISTTLLYPLYHYRREQVHTFTFLHLTAFFHSEKKKSIFEFKLTCN